MHAVVGDVTDAYVALVDAAVPDRIEGLYVVGSVALDDFVPDQSDIDFIAVTADRLDEGTLDSLAKVHQELGDRFPRPWFSGVYVTWADLAADPRGLDAVPVHHEGRFSPAGGFEANPVQWLTLRTHPVAIRGDEAPDVWTDPDGVREWVLGNVNTYWRAWIARQRTLVGRGTMLLPEWAIGWGVLGISRMHYTLTTGEVTSKTGAGEHALATFDDRWAPIVSEALRLRRGEGSQPEAYRRRPLVRRRDALDFMAHVVDEAAALAGTA
jgi:hypothetical protein